MMNHRTVLLGRWRRSRFAARCATFLFAILLSGSLGANTPSGLVVFGVQQPDGSCIELSFQIWNDAYAEITGGSIGVPAVACDIYESIDIPARIDRWPVRIIGDWAFAGLKRLKKASIPTSVIHIGYGAFQGCGLETVTIPGSVWSVGSNYAYQSLLSSFNQSEEAERWVMSYCWDLYSNTIAQKSAQGGCITPSYWLDVMQMTISGYRTTGGVFANCKDLRSVIVEKSNIVAPYACQSGYELYSYPDVRSLGDYTFAGCECLSSVSLPDDLTGLGESLFRDCSSLETFRIPADMKSLSAEAFLGCSSLRQFEVSDDNYDFFAWNGVLYSYSGEKLIKVPASCEFVDTEAILEGVGEIGSYAFADCQHIVEVSLPDEVSLANNIQLVTNVSETVSSGSGVSVNIWHTFTSNVLASADTLTRNGILSSLSEEGSSIHESSTTNITISAWGTKSYVANRGIQFANNLEEFFYECELTSEILSSCGTSVHSCWGVESIVSEGPVGVFSNCRNLRKVVLGEQCSMIQNEMFKGCSSLTNVSFRGPIRAIGNDAFSGCSSLPAIEIPDGVSQIGYGAFAGCRKLKQVVFPPSLAAIGDVSNWGSDTDSRDCVMVVSSNINWSVQWSFNASASSAAAEEATNGNEPHRSDVEDTSWSSECHFDSNSTWHETQTIGRKVLSRSGSSRDCSSCDNMESSAWSRIIGEGGVASILESLQQIFSKAIRHDESYDECYSDLQVESKSKELSELKHTSVFIGCVSLTNVAFSGDAPLRGRIAPDVFYGMSEKTRVTIPMSSGGWDEKFVYTTIPRGVDSNRLSAKEILSLFGNAVDYTYDSSKTVAMYSASSRPVAVPREWFARYGLEDIISKDSSVAAITSTVPETIAGLSLPRSLYESYVAGLDPTNETVQFSATIDFVDGKPVVGCTPELDPDEAAMRKYTVYGKASLADEDWSVVQDDCEKYQFFKVSVEIR